MIYDVWRNATERTIMHDSLSDEALKELYIRGGMTDWGYEALVKEMYERGYSN